MAALVVALALLGLSVGSFVNTVALRLLAGEGVEGRSRCLACGRRLRWFELIPAVSFLLQRGRCRSCQAPISLRYPSGEIGAALLFAGIAWRFFLFPNVESTFSDGSLTWLDFFFTLELILWLSYATILLIFFETDLTSQLLPDRLMYPAIAFSFFGSFAETFITPPTAGWSGGLHWLGPFGMLGGWFSETLWGRAAIAAGASLFFFLISLISHGRWMGWGDGKLAFLLAMMFGFPEIVMVLTIGFLLGGTISGYLLLSARRDRRSQIPLGPFLIAGGFLVIIAGENILRWYFSLFSL